MFDNEYDWTLVTKTNIEKPKQESRKSVFHHYVGRIDTGKTADGRAHTDGKTDIYTQEEKQTKGQTQKKQTGIETRREKTLRSRTIKNPIVSTGPLVHRLLIHWHHSHIC